MQNFDQILQLSNYLSLQTAAVVEVVGYLSPSARHDPSPGPPGGEMSGDIATVEGDCGGRKRRLTPPPEEGDGEEWGEPGEKRADVSVELEEEELASRPDAVDDDPVPGHRDPSAQI